MVLIHKFLFVFIGVPANTIKVHFSLKYSLKAFIHFLLSVSILTPHPQRVKCDFRDKILIETFSFAFATLGVNPIILNFAHASWPKETPREIFSDVI